MSMKQKIKKGLVLAGLAGLLIGCSPAHHSQKQEDSQTYKIEVRAYTEPLDKMYVSATTEDTLSDKVSAEDESESHSKSYWIYVGLGATLIGGAVYLFNRKGTDSHTERKILMDELDVYEDESGRHVGLGKPQS